ncbi:MAG: flagellar hook-basal body protein [Erysipelothrix sp.]|nr:flagellar hook-basal body protein [Erysipelothrix sp.]
MNISFYNASTALAAYQRHVESISHNIANVNTVGYKSQNLRFEDALYTQLNAQSTQALRGHGVVATTLVHDFTQGPLQTTHQALDFAIMGPGFFAKETSEGIVYSRSGSFNLGQTDQGTYLVDAYGNFILDTQFQRISISIDNQDQDIAQLKDRLGIFHFDHLQSLVKDNESNYRSMNEQAGVVNPNATTTLVQGALESSNLSLTDGMVALMEGQKAIQLNARVIQTADQLEEIINNLR